MDSQYRFRNLALLVAIGCTLLAIFAFTKDYLESGRYEAEIINRSGAQRMLSQRIALFTSYPDFLKAGGSSSRRIDQFRSAIARMEGNHQFLIGQVGALSKESDFTEELQSLYFGEEDLDKRVVAYIAQAKEFLELGEDAAIAGDSLSKRIQHEAIDGEFLKLLDDAVNLFQLKAEGTLNRFQFALIVLYLVALSLLGVQYLFIFRPITQRLNRTIAELETSNQELTKFAYHVSHDLRAPVLTCKGLVDMAEIAINEQDQELVRESFQHIKESVEQQITLSDKIIHLTQGKLDQDEESSFTVRSVIEEALSTFTDEIEESGLSVKVDNGYRESISSRRETLKQALECLISNAVDYIDPGKEKHRLKIRTELNKDQVIISVSDNGLGIPLNQEDRLFKMFQRLHPKASKGSGLGLYMVKQNIGLLGGEVGYVRHRELTEFRISIPLGG